MTAARVAIVLPGLLFSFSRYYSIIGRMQTKQLYTDVRTRPFRSVYNNPARNKKSWAPGEFDTGNAKPYSKWNTTKGAQGYYDTRRALMQAYGTKNVNDINNLIAHANKVRREDTGAYNLAPVPDRVKRDESLLSLAKKDLKWATKYEKAGPMAYDPTPSWLIELGGRKEHAPAVIREGGGPQLTRRFPEQEWYSGLRHPKTKHVASRLMTPHSAISHEMTHALNWRKNVEEPALFSSLLARAYNNATYNAENPEEAYQNSAQMKRIAYNKFYKEHGRFPSGEQELRKAYTDVANSDNPVSFEHVRFINEMTPVNYLRRNGQWWPQKELDLIKQINIRNWINQMLDHDKNGNFFQDALVRRGHTGVEKTAGAKNKQQSLDKLLFRLAGITLKPYL